MSMIADLEIVISGKILLEAVQEPPVNFDGLSACQAPEVVMGFMPVDVLVMLVAVFKIGFLDQAGFQQMGNQAVNGGFGYRFSFLLETQE